MLSVKRSTPVYSTAQQQSSFKPSGDQTLSAQEKDKVLGGEQDIGAYANKIADPNWVDPSKTRRVGNPELDKDAFMKLFLAQLKNQDPTNPMQNHELAAQLAQFSSLEKLNSIDTGISSMTKQNDPKAGYDSLNLIGKAVGGDSSKIFRTDKKARHDITFNLGKNATDVELSVKNAAGQEVKKLVAHSLKEGANKVTWDGMIEAGNPAPEGEYNVTITAKNAAGQKIVAESKFEGLVTGVNFTVEGPVLMIGKQSIRLSDVKKIFDPKDLAVGGATQADVKAFVGKDAHNLINPAAMGGNLESVGMAQGLINKLEKDANKAAAPVAAQNQQQPNEKKGEVK